MASQKPLKFIHIAKNAGTSIEQIGKDHGLLWGALDPEYVEVEKSQTTLSRHTIPTKLSPDYIKKYDFFMVVRNPYKRALSQILFLRRARTVEHLNQYAKEFLNTTKLNSIQIDSGITTEQYKYIIPGVHILRFENLEEDFNKLMVQYGLPARLTKHLNKSWNDSVLKVTDFDANTIQMIQTIYKRDFETFGYSLDISVS